jgi:hypothetical protein
VIVNQLPESSPTAQFDATVTNNTIGNGTAFSGSAQGDGMIAAGDGEGDSRFAIRNNLIRSYAQIGLRLRSQQGIAATDTTSYTVTGNTIDNPSGNGFEGILLSSGAANGDNTIVCADISTNTFDTAGTGGVDDLAFSKLAITDMRLPGYTTGGDIQNYIRGRNNGQPTVANYNNPLTGQGTPVCVLPTLPPRCNRRAAFCRAHGVTDAAAIGDGYQALQVDERNPEVGVPQWVLDDVQRHVLSRHLDRVRVSQLVRSEPAPHSRLGMRVRRPFPVMVSTASSLIEGRGFNAARDACPHGRPRSRQPARPAWLGAHCPIRCIRSRPRCGLARRSRGL